MNQNFNQLQVRFPGIGCWLFVLGTVWLLGAIGIGGIIKSIAALVLFVFLAPVLGLLGFQFWLKRNLVNGDCPVCGQTLTGLKNSKLSCPNCTTVLSVTAEGFERASADGVIDVQAVGVQSGDAQFGDAQFGGAQSGGAQSGDAQSGGVQTVETIAGSLDVVEASPAMDDAPVIDVEAKSLPEADG